MGIVLTVTTVAPIVAIVQDTFKIHAGTIDAHLTGQASGYTLVNYIDLFTSRLAMSNLWMPLINKADGNNIEKAKLAASHFRNALHLFPAPDSGWSPKVLTYSGFYGLGIKEIWDMVDEYFAFVKANGYFEQRRNEQAKYWMYESINEHLRDSFYNNETIASMLAVKEEEVLNGKLTSFVAAKKLLDAYYDTLK